MLQKLVIKNYAIIDNLVIEPDSHLNTVTGETGAGKSIILGALSLILGERADTAVLTNKTEKSVVEGYFDVKDNAAFQKAMTRHDLDADDQCLIRREIAVSGKSRAFVNDTPVTLPVLNELSSLLVDLHQQFGHLALEDDYFQLEALDAIGNTTSDIPAYRAIYTNYRKVRTQLNELREKQAQWQKEADFRQYLLEELAQAAFKPSEIEEANLQLRQMGNAERIIQTLAGARLLLEEGERPFINELRKVGQQLQSLSEIVPSLKPLQERLTSVWAELKDISAELAMEEEKVNVDPEAMEELQQRLDLGYKLLKKHGLQETAELIALQKRLETELAETMNLSATMEQLAAEETGLLDKLTKEGEKLSTKRQKSIPAFTKKMNELLILVGMPNARFDAKVERIAPGPYGMDQVQFMLDANKSGNMLPLQKAASGGEMSRIMLCLKSLTAKALHMPTLIFDEVDTGISGEAARQVGVLLQQLSQYHQVICITHQPQVAARGSRHFYVYKQPDKTGKLATHVRTLETDERVLAIARMIGGEQPSEAAISNARELVGS